MKKYLSALAKDNQRNLTLTGKTTVRPVTGLFSSRACDLEFMTRMNSQTVKMEDMERRRSLTDKGGDEKCSMCTIFFR